MWAGRATTTDDASGEALIAELTQEDIDQAMAAAKAVGDDRIQTGRRGESTRRPGPTGRQRSGCSWFMTGYEQGSLEACDTFSASSL